MYPQQQYAHWGTQAQNLRERQIASLTTFFGGSAREIQRGVTYEVSFAHPQLATIFKLTTFLPPNFPDQPPIVSVAPPVQHVWVNNQMVVTGHDKLRQWDYYASLGKILKDIEQDFLLRPPRLLNAAPPQFGSGPSPVSAQQQHYLASPIVSTHQYSPQTVPAAAPQQPPQKPQQPSQNPPPQQQAPQKKAFDFPELKKKDEDFLEDLLNDDVKLFDYIQNSEQIKKILKGETDLIAENEKLAKANLKRKDEMDALKAETEQLREKYTTVREKYEVDYDVLQVESSKFSKETLLSTLRSGADDADSICEQLMDNFITQKMDVDSFVKHYLEHRRLYHTRVLKLEKFQSTP